MSKLGTRTKSSSSRGGASGHASDSSSSSRVVAGTSLPVVGSGRIAIVPPVETTTITPGPVAKPQSAARRLPASRPSAMPNSSSTLCTFRRPMKRSRTAATTSSSTIANSETSVVAVPRA